MAGYQTAASGNLILQRGRPPTPVVDISLVCRPSALTQSGHKIRRHKNQPLSDALIAGIREDRAKGFSANEVGKKFGVTHTTVLVHTRDIPPPEGGWKTGYRKTRFNLPKAQRMRRAGFSYAEIAEEFGTVRGAVWNLLNKRTGKSALGGDGRTARILRAVSEATGVDRKLLIRRKQDAEVRPDKDVSRARHIVFWLMARRREMPAQAVGACLRGFDQSSIRHGVYRVDEVLASNDLKSDLPLRKFASAVWAAKWPARNAA